MASKDITICERYHGTTGMTMTISRTQLESNTSLCNAWMPIVSILLLSIEFLSCPEYPLSQFDILWHTWVPHSFQIFWYLSLPLMYNVILGIWWYIKWFQWLRINSIPFHWFPLISIEIVGIQWSTWMQSVHEHLLKCIEFHCVFVIVLDLWWYPWCPMVSLESYELSDWKQIDPRLSLDSKGRHRQFNKEFNGID